MDVKDKDRVTTLFNRIKISRKELEPFRISRKKLVEQYVGAQYSGNKPQMSVLINLLQQTAETYMVSLAANRPRCLVTTKIMQHRQFARHYQDAINNLAGKIELGDILAEIVLDAFFKLGIVKVHHAEDAEVLIGEDMWIDPGKPYVSRISLDNWVHDTAATSWREIQFSAEAYRSNFDSVEQDDRNDKKVVKKLKPTRPHILYPDGQDPVENISRDSDIGDDEVEDTIGLIDVWLPRDQIIVTWPTVEGHPFEIDSELGPLRTVNWYGTRRGPYRYLSFNDVPDNTMPTSPADNLIGLHMIANKLLRKQQKQAYQQRDIPIYSGQSGAQDAERLRTAPHGQFTKADKESVDVVKFGGVDPGNQAFLQQIVLEFDRHAGNLTAMAGIGPQSDTASQDEMIHAQISKREAKMQQRVNKLASEVMYELGYLLWVDEFTEIPNTIRVGDDEIEDPWLPSQRAGSPEDFDMTVEPQSMPYKSKGERINAIQNLLERFYIPLAQGGLIDPSVIDINVLLELQAEMHDLPRLKELIKMTPPAEPQGEPPRQAANTTRTNIRKNVPTGGTEQSRRATMAQSWLNGSQNQDQAAAMTRAPA